MSKYDLYLRDIKNKYTTNNQQNNLGLSDAEIEAQASRAASNQVMKENQTLLKRDYSGLSNETNQISIDADINKIQWAEEYDEESLEWWEQVGAWISQAKNILAETFIKMGTENLVDAGAIVGAMVADAMGNKDASEHIQNFVKMDLTGDLIFNQDWYRQIDEKIFGEKASKFAYNDKATQDWVKKMSQSIGSMLGFAALWNIPYVGPGIAATSVGGASTEEALREGANAEQAFAYGLGSAAIESITELTVGKLLDFIGKGGSKVVNKIFKTNFSGKAANDVIAGIGKQYGKSILLNTLKDMNEEGVEEVVSSLLQPILQMIYKECDENDFFGHFVSICQKLLN